MSLVLGIDTLVACVSDNEPIKPVSEPMTESSPEYQDVCFSITPDLTIAASTLTTTPSEFLRQDPNVLVAINGPFYDTSGKTLGVVYLSDDHHLGNKQGRISGYFTVDKNGDQVDVQETFSNNYSDYWLVIGTHPILVDDAIVHSQAKQERYNKRIAYRSAIGTKDGESICFAVSDKMISMEKWATVLQQSQYKDALNLDGGPISQMASREDGIEVSGGGNQPTHLVIFAYSR